MSDKLLNDIISLIDKIQDQYDHQQVKILANRNISYNPFDIICTIPSFYILFKNDHRSTNLLFTSKMIQYKIYSSIFDDNDLYIHKQSILIKSISFAFNKDDHFNVNHQNNQFIIQPLSIQIDLNSSYFLYMNQIQYNPLAISIDFLSDINLLIKPYYLTILQPFIDILPTNNQTDVKQLNSYNIIPKSIINDDFKSMKIVDNLSAYTINTRYYTKKEQAMYWYYSSLSCISSIYYQPIHYLNITVICLLLAYNQKDYIPIIKFQLYLNQINKINFNQLNALDIKKYDIESVYSCNILSQQFKLQFYIPSLHDNIHESHQIIQQIIAKIQINNMFYKQTSLFDVKINIPSLQLQVANSLDIVLCYIHLKEFLLNIQDYQKIYQYITCSTMLNINLLDSFTFYVIPFISTTTFTIENIHKKMHNILSIDIINQNIQAINNILLTCNQNLRININEQIINNFYDLYVDYLTAVNIAKVDHSLIKQADHSLIKQADHSLIKQADHGLIKQADHSLIKKADHSLSKKAGYFIYNSCNFNLVLGQIDTNEQIKLEANHCISYQWHNLSINKKQALYIALLYDDNTIGKKSNSFELKYENSYSICTLSNYKNEVVQIYLNFKANGNKVELYVQSLYQIYNHLSVDVMLSINKSDNKQLLLSNTSQSLFIWSKQLHDEQFQLNFYQSLSDDDKNTNFLKYIISF